MKTPPILYLVYNRPDLVKKTFPIIKRVRPKVLFIAGDGPRKNDLQDELQCKEVKSYLQRAVDWDCELNHLYQDQNLGCGTAVSTAISWFFSNVSEGVILEDDCLVDESFFSFCNDMLIKYRNIKQVYHITGSNWQKGKLRGKADYYFSYIPAIWGWATWSDRWSSYNFDIFSDERKFEAVFNNLDNIVHSKAEKEFHLSCFEACRDNKIDTWDYQWRFAIFYKLGLCIVPNTNLVSNIGHRDDGTHTKDSSHWRANLQVGKITGPLNHPRKIILNKKADLFLAQNLFLGGEKTKKFQLRNFFNRIRKLKLVHFES